MSGAPSRTQRIISSRLDSARKFISDALQLARYGRDGTAQECYQAALRAHRDLVAVLNIFEAEVDDADAWTPFEESNLGNDPKAHLIRSADGYVGTFINSRYQVQLMEYEGGLGPMTWMMIVRRDRRALPDWRDFQRIKNELLGPEREAFEMYPAESRLVDTNNQYHLFVLPEGATMPVGYAERDVADVVEGTAHQQRPFDVVPEDLNERGDIAARGGRKGITTFGPPLDG